MNDKAIGNIQQDVIESTKSTLIDLLKHNLKSDVIEFVNDVVEHQILNAFYRHGVPAADTRTVEDKETSYILIDVETDGESLGLKISSPLPDKTIKNIFSILNKSTINE